MNEQPVEQTVDPLDNWQEMLAALQGTTATPQKPEQAQHKSAMERYQQRRHGRGSGSRSVIRRKKHDRKCKTCRQLNFKYIYELRRHLRRRNKRVKVLKRMLKAQANSVKFLCPDP